MTSSCRPTRRRLLFFIFHFSFSILLVSCGQPASSGGKAAWPGPFSPPPQGTPAPAPIAFPRDEAPHDTLTEWWYYTGHLQAEDGARYGFESVIFQSIRSTIPAY